MIGRGPSCPVPLAVVFVDALVCSFTDPPPLKVSNRGVKSDSLGVHRAGIRAFSADERWGLPQVGVGLGGSAEVAHAVSMTGDRSHSMGRPDLHHASRRDELRLVGQNRELPLDHA